MSAIVIFSIFLTAILAAISYIDIRQMRIPNTLNALLFGTGVAFCLSGGHDGLTAQLIFALGVSALFWAVRGGHTALTGRVGLGLGDVKMAGAGALWISPVLFPLFLLIASMIGLFYIAIRGMFLGTPHTNERLPFAPCLSIGLLLTYATEASVR
jgi:prepilin signal peptidase PulO-like enzyme (type II secretory pathway)